MSPGAEWRTDRAAGRGKRLKVGGKFGRGLGRGFGRGRGGVKPGRGSSAAERRAERLKRREQKHAGVPSAKRPRVDAAKTFEDYTVAELRELVKEKERQKDKASNKYTYIRIYMLISRLISNTLILSKDFCNFNILI